MLADGLEDLQRWLHIANMEHWQLQLNVPCTTEGHACQAEASSCSILNSVYGNSQNWHTKMASALRQLLATCLTKCLLGTDPLQKYTCA